MPEQTGRRWITGLFLAGLCLLIPQEILAAEEPAEKPSSSPERPNQKTRPNLRMKTLGGVQFWGDVEFFHGWHIQQNVFSKHYRLLDEADVRHAWGSLEHCRQVLQEIREKQNLPKMAGTAVILVHGLGRSDKSMRKLQTRLEEDGYLAIGFNYPSTRVDVAAAADYLRQVVNSLDGIEKIHLVPFSLGGLVVRSYLSKDPDPRLQRMVMIGTPNLGADLASRFQKNWAYRLATGPAGQELVIGEVGAGEKLPVPDLEFAVIAGARGTDEGYNPLIPGDDDGTVAVQSTRLPGAADFMTVPTLHSWLLSHPDTLKAVSRFLETGGLQETPPAPIPAQQKAADDVESSNGTVPGQS